MDMRTLLADNLRFYRLKSGLNVEEVGRAVGRSNKTVSAWEVGRGQPDADMLLKLCSLYGIKSISEFFGEEAPCENLTTLERRLLVAFRGIAPSDQPAIVRLVEGSSSAGDAKSGCAEPMENTA